jgi:hypothetical protein
MMEFTRFKYDNAEILSNTRAEDGIQPVRRDAFYEGVLIPLGTIFAVFLFVLGVMLLNV